MNRLTDKRMRGNGFIPVDPKEYKAFIRNEKPTGKQIYQRLLEIEDILGDDYGLDRLRELVESDRDGRCVVYKKDYPVMSHYYQGEDGLYVREVSGVISKEDYEDALKGE